LYVLVLAFQHESGGIATKALNLIKIAQEQN